MKRQACLCATVGMLVSGTARAQIAGGTDVVAVSTSPAPTDLKCAIAKNPANKMQLAAACNASGNTVQTAYSSNLGATWTAGPSIIGARDPSLAWAGNLYLAYTQSPDQTRVTLQYSDTSGAAYTELSTFSSGTNTLTRPDVAALPDGANDLVWLLWHESDSIPNAVGASVPTTSPTWPSSTTVQIPAASPAPCRFGDLAIAPDKSVAHVCEGTTSSTTPQLRVNVKGPALSAAFNQVKTVNINVSANHAIFGFTSFNAQSSVAFNLNSGALTHPGRLFVAYTDSTSNTDTDIKLIYSDNKGFSWSPTIAVTPGSDGFTQFFPKVASNSDSGNTSLCWYSREGANVNTVCTIARPGGTDPDFLASATVSDAPLTAASGQKYSPIDLAYFKGYTHPIWSVVPSPLPYNAFTDAVSGNPAAMEGDPHITTVDGIHFDFQGAGEYVSLIDGSGMEIQTRQTAVGTTFFPGANPYTGLATCVSLNTAVAARVGKHRVSYQPGGTGEASTMELRIDGQLTRLEANEIDLGDGGSVGKAPAGEGIKIMFPDDTILVVTANFWASQQKWYLNVNVLRTPGLMGLMGALARGSWLPPLPNGASMGPKPESLQQRYADLYQKWGGAWRVDAKSSLFDYAPGTSPASFVMQGWPPMQGPCTVPNQQPASPTDQATAAKACDPVTGANRKADCIFDVMATGEVGFAKTYLVTQQLESGLTSTVVGDERDPTKEGEAATFTGIVRRMVGDTKTVIVGAVQFFVDGAAAGPPVSLDQQGRAVWKTSTLSLGKHKIRAAFVPSPTGGFFASKSGDELHTVTKKCTGACCCDIGGRSEATPAGMLALVLFFAALVWRRRRSAR